MTTAMDLIQSKRVIIFDLETKTLIPQNKDLSDEERICPMEISAGGYYDSLDEQIYAFSENTIGDKFIPALQEADLVVSYNGIAFDYLVLQKYLDFDVSVLPTWDLYARIKDEVRFRPSLNGVAKGTLGISKSGEGADAPTLFRQRKWETLKKYVIDDVRITKDIFYESLNGKIEYVTKKNKRMLVDTSSWHSELQKVIYQTEVLPGDWIIIKSPQHGGVDIYDLNARKIDHVLNIQYRDGVQNSVSREVLCRILSMEFEKEKRSRSMWHIDKPTLLPIGVLDNDLEVYKNSYTILERIYGSLYISYADYRKYDLEEVLPLITEATGRKFEIKRYGSNIAIKRDWK